jgi:SNF family Na+-dependent transporter
MTLNDQPSAMACETATWSSRATFLMASVGASVGLAHETCG